MKRSGDDYHEEGAGDGAAPGGLSYWMSPQSSDYGFQKSFTVKAKTIINIPANFETSDFNSQADMWYLPAHIMQAQMHMPGWVVNLGRVMEEQVFPYCMLQVNSNRHKISNLMIKSDSLNSLGTGVNTITAFNSNPYVIVYHIDSPHGNISRTLVPKKMNGTGDFTVNDLHLYNMKTSLDRYAQRKWKSQLWRMGEEHITLNNPITPQQFAWRGKDYQGTYAQRTGNFMYLPYQSTVSGCPFSNSETWPDRDDSVFGTTGFIPTQMPKMNALTHTIGICMPKILNSDSTPMKFSASFVLEQDINFTIKFTDIMPENYLNLVCPWDSASTKIENLRAPFNCSWMSNQMNVNIFRETDPNAVPEE